MATKRMSAVGVNQRKRFLEVLTETGNVAGAAATAEIAVDTLFRLRDAEPDFAAAWARALDIGYELVESALLAALRGTKPEGFDTALARQLLQQRGSRPTAAAIAAATAGAPSRGAMEAEVLRLLDGGRPHVDGKA